MKTECSKPNCNRGSVTRGMCKSHYEEWRKIHRGEVAPRASKWYADDGTRMPCMFEGCVKPIQSQGLCKSHYQNFHYESTRGQTVSRKNRKITDYDGNRAELKCTFAGCGLPEFNPGLCAGHYYQKRRTGKLAELRETANCTALGCTESYSVSRTKTCLCRRHATLATRYGFSADQLREFFRVQECYNQGCRSTEKLHIDHDHSCCPGQKSCGKCVRGWLCQNCNHALGNLQDSPRRIEGLLDYLDSFKS